MSLTNLKNKVRYLLGDFSQSTSDIFTYENSNVFTLSESNVITVDNAFRNNVELGTSELTYDSDINKVTLNVTLVAGDTVEIKYSYYPNYSDTEILGYIQATLVHLSINNYYDFEYDSTDDEIYPTPEDKEENLIAIITSLLINPDNKSIRLPDISIAVPDDLPLNAKISKTIATFKKDSHGIFDIL